MVKWIYFDALKKRLKKGKGPPTGLLSNTYTHRHARPKKKKKELETLIRRGEGKKLYAKQETPAPFCLDGSDT